MTNIGNWQAEYGIAITPEDCEEVKGFCKPYLEKPLLLHSPQVL